MRPQALDPSHPFTTAQALAAGISASRLRGAEFRRLSKGKYVAAPETVVITHRGVRLADPAHVFLALAATLSLVDLVAVGDYIARQEWYSPAGLVAVCAASKQAHSRRALAAARFVRDGVDSPMETRLRMLLVLAGFPEPQVNFILRDGAGSVRRRFDLCYPEVRVIVEYDGRQHAESPQQYDWDIKRRDELEEAGWRVVVVTAKGMYTDPEDTLERVRRALRAQGLAGVPTRFHRLVRQALPRAPHVDADQLISAQGTWSRQARPPGDTSSTTQGRRLARLVTRGRPRSDPPGR